MTTPKNRPELTEEQLAAAREALARPGFDEVVAALPPELRKIIEQAKGALGSSDPAAAFEALANEAAADPMMRPEAIEQAVTSALAGAMASLGGGADVLREAEAAAKAVAELGVPDVGQALPTEGSAGAAAEALTRILDRVRDYDLTAMIGPILGDVRALEADLQAIPGKIGALRGDPKEAARLVAALEERALRLEAAAAELGGTDLLATLAEAMHDAEDLLVALQQGSPQIALTRGALLARAGDRQGSQQAFAVSLDLAEAQGVLDAGATAATALQLDALQRNDLKAAHAIAVRVTRLATKAGDRRKAVLSRYDEGLLLARTGAASEGEGIVIDALDEARALTNQELIARGLVVLGKIREGEGDEAGALRIFEGLLAHAGTAGLEAEVAQGAMGVLRLIDTDAIVDPRRFQSLAIVREWSRKTGDAGTFGQSSLLLAESEEARGDRLAALKAVLEGREAMRASPDANPDPMDRALAQLRSEWGHEVFDALMHKLTGPFPGSDPAEA